MEVKQLKSSSEKKPNQPTKSPKLPKSNAAEQLEEGSVSQGPGVWEGLSQKAPKQIRKTVPLFLFL